MLLDVHSDSVALENSISREKLQLLENH